MYGPSKNPFDLAKNTGGSSGGSAGAVADGLLPFAEGTDGGGSIRIPASWCGVFGYKPSFGRVPFAGRPNAFGGTAPFLFEGPISRTVEDAALAMSVLAGYDSRDPYSIEGSVDFMSSVAPLWAALRTLRCTDATTSLISSRPAGVDRVLMSSLRAFSARSM